MFERRNKVLTKSKIELYFDLADVFMVAISGDEIVIDVNKLGCEILGFAKEEIVGKNWFDSFLTQATRENSRIVFHEALKGSLSHLHYEHSIVTKEGNHRVINCIMCLLRMKWAVPLVY
jgi:two-component system NtrC family sensor kinase